MPAPRTVTPIDVERNIAIELVGSGGEYHEVSGFGLDERGLRLLAAVGAGLDDKTIPRGIATEVVVGAAFVTTGSADKENECGSK